MIKFNVYNCQKLKGKECEFVEFAIAKQLYNVNLMLKKKVRLN